MENQEREISLLSLFRYIMKRWKRIFITALVFALIFTALSFLLEMNRLGAQVEDVVNTMSFDEKNTVLKVRELDSELKDLNYYIEHSALMNMDPYNTQRASVSYFVDTKHITRYAGDTESDLTWDIIAIYVSKLNSNGWKAQALKEAGSDIDLKYFDEMVNVTTTGRTFTVTIKYPDPEQLKTIMKVLQENIDEYKNTINSNICAHSLAISNISMEASVLDRDLKAFQEDKEFQFNSLYDEVSTIKNSFNEKQKTMYYGKILSRQELSTGIISDKPPKAGISVNKFISGGILGAILLAVFYSVQFISQNKFRLEDNIEAAAGIALLGYYELPSSRKQDFINRKIRSSELKILDGLDSEQQFNLILFNIKEKLGDEKELYIVSPENDLLSQHLAEALSGTGINCRIVDNIMKHTEISAQSGAVFVVRSDFTAYPQLSRQIGFCNMHDAKLLGTAVEI